MTGSLVEKKGQSLAIETLHCLHQKGHFFHLDLLGDGPLMPKLKELTNRLKLNSYVHFHGIVNHPEDYLKPVSYTHLTLPTIYSV